MFLPQPPASFDLSAFFVPHVPSVRVWGVQQKKNKNTNLFFVSATLTKARQEDAQRDAPGPTMLVSAAVTGLLVPPVAVEPGSMVLVQHRNMHQLGTERSPAGFPTTTNLNAAVPLYGGLGAPKANRANPAAGGNAENNWWTPSYVLNTDCDGKKVTPTTKLSQECIAKKKVRQRSHRATHTQSRKGPHTNARSVRCWAADYQPRHACVCRSLRSRAGRT